VGSLTVASYRDADAPAWNALVDRSRSSHFLFRREYMDYHRDRFHDSSLMIRDRGRLVAALPAESHDGVITSHGGLTFGGLISDESLSARRVLDAVSAILQRLAALGMRELIYRPVPHIYHVIPAEEDLYALSRHGAELVRRDLSASVRPDRRPRPTKGRRAAIARARRAGITVAASDAFESFMEIDAEMLRARHGAVPTHTPREMSLLARRFPEQISLISGLRDGRLIAGVVVYETPVVAHAQYIAATPEGYELGALDAVIEHLITDRFVHKRFFDFGISTVDGGCTLNEGLMRNKEGFGARGVAYDTYRVGLCG
jgi:hypothetical protein